MPKLVDDSKRVIEYYSTSPGIASSVLQKIVEAMNIWSRYVQTRALNPAEAKKVEEAIAHTNEAIWYETGKRFATAVIFDETVRQIFIAASSSKSWKSRFNVIALSESLPRDLSIELVTAGINDKSSKVREKSADLVLSLRERSLLRLLEERREIEGNAAVIDAIDLALKEFDKGTDGDGGQVIIVE